ncbi:hypothetical protein [Vulcanisaeta souniana]|uniref:hypothetical protein n=1 Tax=Vulcanisaeta souniana TaxID=164452 RepID=UPI0006D2C570|nr:hypothetical protein [Vulcanisaeta souniana]
MVDALEWLRAVINAIAETVRKYVWSNIKYRDIIALLPVLGIIAPVVDYIIRVIFSSNLPGSGEVISHIADFGIYPIHVFP